MEGDGPTFRDAWGTNIRCGRYGDQMRPKSGVADEVMIYIYQKQTKARCVREGPFVGVTLLMPTV